MTEAGLYIQWALYIKELQNTEHYSLPVGSLVVFGWQPEALAEFLGLVVPGKQMGVEV